MRLDAKKIELTKDEADEYNRLLDINYMDFDEEGISKDSIPYRHLAKFDDGVVAELRICAGSHNMWAEVSWFAKDGGEICYTEPFYEIENGDVAECSWDEKYDVELKIK